ncbi:putative retrotransposon hot spot protein (RHS,) [Trypanosoma cruzi]|uniref:Putative retrotransposon hot spot protein (RHS,) n=1 Tax=Trypanosoma cruzi TaxID=5693 RepID=A0A2V2UM74_TRYCR|nr:putative retrotransposon hot spot protein (RHS,) [Trypanosoma cruzi]
MSARDFFFLLLGMRDNFFFASLEKYALNAFLNVGFVTAIVTKLKELPPPSSKPRSSVPTLNPQGYPTEATAITELELFDCPQDLNYRLPYLPTFPNSLLLDGFFFVESNPMTLVGLRMATAGGHHTATSTVRQFSERLAEYFNGWRSYPETFCGRSLTCNTPMSDWRRCDVDNPNSVSGDESREIRRSGRRRRAST